MFFNFLNSMRQSREAQAVATAQADKDHENLMKLLGQQEASLNAAASQDWCINGGPFKGVGHHGFC